MPPGKGLLYAPKRAAPWAQPYGVITVAEALDRDIMADVWAPKFPSAELVGQAADMLPAVRHAVGQDAEVREGPHWHISVAPGAVSVRSKDYARAERTHERQVRAQQHDVDWLAADLADKGDFPADPPSTREITGWSRKSRSNMVERLCELDYTALFPAGRLPAMVTLTYPNAWQRVAPNGAAAKKHLKKLRKRWERTWGEPLAAVWKLEFQRRGAPHFHLLVSPPHGQTADGENFRTWLSRSWAEVVAHPDSEEYAKHVAAGTGIDWNDGLRSTDPKRVAVYFTKHGAFQAKEYQHCVPEEWQQPGQGPGRFWGYWVLKPAKAAVEVSPQDAVKAARTIRRWARAQGTTRQVTKPRVEQATGRVRYRSTRVRVKRLGGGRGFVSVNDGAQFASQLARHLTEDQPTRDERRARWRAAHGLQTGPVSEGYLSALPVAATST